MEHDIISFWVLHRNKNNDVDMHRNWLLWLQKLSPNLKNAHRQTSLKTSLLYLQKDPVLRISLKQSTREFSHHLQSQCFLAKEAFSGLDKVMEGFPLCS